MCEGELPFRTIIMIIGLVSDIAIIFTPMLTDPGPVQVTHLVVSWAAYYVFCLWGADLGWDLLSCFERTEDGAEVVVLGTSAQLDTPVKTLEVSSFPSDL